MTKSWHVHVIKTVTSHDPKWPVTHSSGRKGQLQVVQNGEHFIEHLVKYRYQVT